MVDGDRVFAPGQRQHGRPGRRCVQGWPVRARQSPLLAREERDDGRRGAVGPPRDVPRRLRRQRFQAPVLLQIQLLGNHRRSIVMRNITRVWLGVVAALIAVGLWSGTFAQGGDPQKAVDTAYQQYRNLKEGKNADYIPALA